jgi:gluconokinase
MSTVALHHAEPPLILSIDLGTSSTRVLLFDAQGRAVEGVLALEKASVVTDGEGRAEENAAESIARVGRCIDAALQQLGERAARIGGVAVDTLASSIMAVDDMFKPLTPLLIYADTRNAADAVALQRTLNERAVHERTGCMLRTSYWPARLAWFQRTQPELWQRAARWITIGEYLEQCLFGQSRVSYSIASWSGLLDRQTLEWDQPLLDVLGITTQQLAPLVDLNQPLHGLQGEYARRWPALRDVPWFPALGDGAAANIGSGAVGSSRAALTVGTTGAVRIVLPHVDHVPPGLWCYRVDKNRALLGGATSEGGNVYGWIRGMAQLGEKEHIEPQLAALPPDGHGLTVLPFWAGERSPGWAGDVRATISGLSLSTTPLEILRASLEAVAYRFAIILDRLPPADNRQLVASGGGLLSSPAWMQIMADVLGLPVIASMETEGTSRGTALLALEALGQIDAVEHLPGEDGEVFQPNPNNHRIYRAAVERQRALYQKLIG